jgi:hypothetical protein
MRGGCLEEIGEDQVQRRDAVEEESEGWLDVMCEEWTRPQ